MSVQHTPGPWRALPVEAGKPYIRIRGAVLGSRYKIANILTPDYDGASEHEMAESRANARLIVAAPDMFIAACGLGAMPEGYCFCSSDRIGNDTKRHEPECRDLRAAIAKVTLP